MGILKKILLIIIIIFIVGFCAGYILTAVFAKPLIKDAIEKQLNLKTEVASASLGFPLNLNIGGLTVENLAKIEKIKVSISIIGLFSGRIILNNITLIRPDITLKREKDGSFNIPQVTSQDKKKILITGLTIKDGLISAFDRKITPGIFSFAIKDINAEIYKPKLITYPLTIKYTLGALIPSRPGIEEASVKGEGWIDLSHKDMQGDFNISNIDVIFFKPYFGRFIPSSAEIASSQANFNADLSAKNNDLLISCRLTIKNLPTKKEVEPLPEKPQAEKPSPESLVLPSLELLINPQGEIVFDFEIKTKLDRPRLNRITLKGKIFQNILEKAIQEPQAVVDTIKDIGEHLKDKGKEIEKTFKSILEDIKE